MLASFGSFVLLTGLLLLIGTQLAIGLHALTGNPLKGLLCIVMPLYVYVYAQRWPVGKVLMRGWYAGAALLVLGGILAS